MFLFAFSTMLLMQRDSETAFSIENTIRDSLFSSNPAPVKLATPHAIYDWFQSTVLTSFKDPVCGDGVCGGLETKSYAHFGCFVDCGAYSKDVGRSNTLMTTVHVELALKQNRDEKEFLDHVVRWNICSKSEGR